MRMRGAHTHTHTHTHTHVLHKKESFQAQTAYRSSNSFNVIIRNITLQFKKYIIPIYTTRNFTYQNTLLLSRS